MALKYSRQRQAVWDFIKDREDHPTASVVYEGVRESYPNISLGTVYRNLMLLKEMGRISSVDIGDNAVHFDSNINQHEHFLCRKCGALRDLNTYDMPAAGLHLKAAGFAGRVESYSIIYSGICESCLKKEEEEN